MAQENLRFVTDRIRRLLGCEDTVKEIGSVLGLRGRKLLRGLGDTISRLAPKLVDAEKKRSSIDDERDSGWLMRLEDALYDADNLLEHLSTTAEALALRRRRWSWMTTAGAGGGRNNNNKMANQVHTFFSTFTPYYRLKVRQDLEKIKKRVDEIEAESIDIQYPADEAGALMINRKEDKIGIIDHLLRYGNDVRVLAIVGDKGIGKTRLAKDVFNDDKVQSHFDVKIWVDVSHNFDPVQILTEITARSTNFYAKRCLIVLDDVWNQDKLSKWQFLIDCLEDVGLYGSQIIVTTRSTEVALSFRCIMLSYPLRFLDPDQSLNLFYKMVGRDEKTSYQIQVGREIIDKSMGIPFTITAIGSVLRSSNSEEGWQFLLSLQSLDDRVMLSKRIYIKIIARMAKSAYFDQLPPQLIRCFAYCSLFPGDYEIDVQTLIKLWMAQGFIEPSSGNNKSVEDTGYDYVLDLLERSRFQDAVTDVRERVKKCRLHYMMRNLACYVAGDQCSILSSRGTSRNGIDRSFHVSFDFDLFSSKDIPNPSIHDEKVRSILLLRQSRQENRGIPDNSICDTIISRFRFLRALDMHDLGIKIVPESIGKLKLLKYLDLSENEDITELPNSIANLVNLQTLKLSSCFGLKKLPRGFKNLINLRHLEIDGCYNLTGVLQGIRQLTNLQTLSQLEVNEETSVRNRKLDEVTTTAIIDKFQIKNLGHGENDMAKYFNLTRQARSLSLEWETHAQEESDKKNTPLYIEWLSDVEVLSLYGFRGDRLLSEGIPSKLVKLSLWRCTNCEILPPLDQLSNLKVLVLDMIPKLEYFSDLNASSSTTILPSLQDLCLTDLPELKGWWKSGVSKHWPESFQCVSKLVIEKCPKLESMPIFPTVEEELVLDRTGCWEPFQLTMLMNYQTTARNDEASSSSSTSTSSYLLSNDAMRFLYNVFQNTTTAWTLDAAPIPYANVDAAPFPDAIFMELPEITARASSPSPPPPPLSKLKKLLPSNVDAAPFPATMFMKRPEITARASSSSSSSTTSPPSKLKKLLPSNVDAAPFPYAMFMKLQEITARASSSSSTSPPLSKLKKLCIAGIENFKADEMKWDMLRSLEYLRFDRLPNLQTLPDELQQVTCLKELHVWRSGLKEIPKCIGQLNNLRKLVIRLCPNLNLIPEEINRLLRSGKMEIED